MWAPFGRTDSMQKNTKYEKLYNEFVKSNKIYIAGYTVIEKSYYIHVKVPSESQKDGRYEYDVVIRLFTDKPELELTNSLRAYYMQFFSNSPGFIYKYAALYKKEDYLIKDLYDKLDSDYKDVMPEKTNSDMILSYDKSIYFACKFLSDGRFRYLSKFGILLQKKKTPEKFFSDISDFKSVKFDHDLLNTERKLKRDIENKNNAERKRTQKRLSDLHRISASTSTSRNGNRSVHRTVKITGGHRITKKVARKSTKRKG
jgi:hypothetical protein